MNWDEQAISLFVNDELLNKVELELLVNRDGLLYLQKRMHPMQKTILFSIRYAGLVHPIQAMPNQYYSLMTLISDQLAVPGFGLCCGMGSCGTCLVQIVDPHSKQKTSVLACDRRVDDGLANVEVIIPDVRF